MKLYDVAVIGGGPVGSCVAYKLAEMGYGVVVLEQNGGVGKRVCCTGIIGKECVGSFKRLSAGTAPYLFHLGFTAKMGYGVKIQVNCLPLIYIRIQM